MCCADRNTQFSNSALWISWPRPVRSRSRSAASTPIAPNMPPMMSLTDVPARSGRPLGPGHVREPAHHLHHFVERKTLFVRPRQESLVRNVDQPRKLLRQRFVVEPERRHEAGPEILEHHVGLADQLEGARLALRRVDVEHDALLVAVERAEKADAEPGQLARLVAARRLDLDDFGAQVGEDHSARRSHDHVREFDDADAVERQRICG